MLSYEQRHHFAEHGWILLEDMLTAEQCQAHIAVLDRLAATTRPLGLFSDSPDLRTIDNLHLHDPVFVEWLRLPDILTIERQLMGADLRLGLMAAHIKTPHSDRQKRAGELRDPDKWGWHRGMRPKWGIVPDDNDPSLVHTTFLQNITYLTDVAPGDGSTAVLDGSHRLEGDYASLKDRCPVVEVPVRAGTILVFTEALLHSAVPILSERTRYNFYVEFVLPWFASHPGYETPETYATLVADEELRQVLAKPLYRGQFPPPITAAT